MIVVQNLASRIWVEFPRNNATRRVCGCHASKNLHSHFRVFPISKAMSCPVRALTRSFPATVLLAAFMVFSFQGAKRLMCRTCVPNLSLPCVSTRPYKWNLWATVCAKSASRLRRGFCGRSGTLVYELGNIYTTATPREDCTTRYSQPVSDPRDGVGHRRCSGSLPSFLHQELPPPHRFGRINRLRFKHYASVAWERYAAT